jgi:hypothetical protein
MMTIEEFEDVLERSLTTVKPRLLIGLDKVGELAETLAASYPGHERPEWAPLAASTLKDKEAKGYPVPSPLLRTGDMAESIKRELDSAELSVTVGSHDQTALWQEMGTSRIPPRPFLALGMKNAMPFAEDVFGEIAVSILEGKK